jgi:hypothetical protein
MPVFMPDGTVELSVRVLAAQKLFHLSRVVELPSLVGDLLVCDIDSELLR